MFTFKNVLATMAICLFALPTLAVDGVGLVIPYKVECVKQSDGTKKIVASALLRTALKAVEVNGHASTTYDSSESTGRIASTTMLQTKASCEDLDALFANSGKLFGFPGQKVSDQETYIFKFANPNLFSLTGLCVYFMDISHLKGNLTDFLKDNFRFNDPEAVQWIALNYTGSEIDAFDGSPYDSDDLLIGESFDAADTALAIEDYLVRLALQKLHGQVCCFPTFDIDEESVQALTLQILDKMNTCPTDFTAKGTHGSCGDTADVTVTGTLTKKTMIDVCGKTLCFTSLPSVGEGNAGMTTAQCFWKFFMTQYAAILNRDEPAKAFKCGLPAEICNLVQGHTVDVKDTSSLFYQLRIICIDEATHTYDFALITSGFSTFNEIATFTPLGCRFKLEECKKCCK